MKHYPQRWLCCWLAVGALACLSAAAAGRELDDLVFCVNFDHNSLDADVSPGARTPAYVYGTPTNQLPAGHIGQGLLLPDARTAIRYSLPLTNGLAEGTLTCWYKPETLEPAARKKHNFFSMSGSSAGIWAYGATAYFRVDIIDNEVSGRDPEHRHINQADLALEKGKWYHFAVVWDSRKPMIRIYLNGVEITADRMPFIVGKPWTMKLPVYLEIGPDPAGVIDAVKLFKRALKTDELAAEAGENTAQKAAYRYQGGDPALPPGPAQGVMNIPQAAARPAIDGHMAPGEWAQAAVISNFYLYNQTNQLPRERTTAWLSYDATNLYIACCCHESRMADIEAKANPESRDVYAGEDCVEIQLNPNLDHLASYHLLLTTRGARFDQREFRYPGSAGVESDLAWNSAWTGAVSKGQSAWTAEIAVPWQDLGVADVFSGMCFGLNLYRERKECMPFRPGHPLEELSSWCLSPNGFQDPAALGLAVLDESGLIFRHTALGTAGWGMNVLRCWLENKGPKPRRLRATGRLAWDGGATALAPVSVEIPANSLRPVEIEYPVSALNARHSLALTVQDSLDDRKIVEAEYQFDTPEILFNLALPVREYYVEDKQATGMLTCGLGEKTLAESGIILEVHANGKLVGQRDVGKLQGRQEAVFDISRIAKGGAARLSARLVDKSGKTVAAAEKEIRKNRYTFPWAFDFGPTNSPLAQGYCRVSEQTQYQPGGFGWTTPVAGLKSYAIPDKEQWNAFDQRFSFNTFYTAASRDCIYRPGSDPTNAAAFACTLPNGRYGVELSSIFWPYVARGALYYRACFHVRANGREVGEVNLPVAGCVANTRFTVEINAGKLELECVPAAGGWVVNSLVIYPLQDAAYAEEEFQRINKAMFVLPAEEEENWVEFVTPHPTNYPRACGAWLLWKVNPLEKIYPDSVPAALAPEPDLSAFCAPGEYEPISFAAHAFQDLTNVNVTIGALRAEDGREISGANLDLRRMRFAPWPLKHCKPGKPGIYLMNPEMLLPEVALPRVRQGETVQWWLTLHVPEQTGEGIFKGALAVTADGLPRREVPVTLEVPPIRLTNAPLHYGFYYNSPLTHISPNYNPAAFGDPALVRASTARLRADVRDMVAHGMDMYISSGDNNWVIRKGSNIVTETWTASLAVREARAAGMQGPIMFMLDSLALNHLVRALTGKPFPLQEINRKGWQAVFTPEYQREFTRFIRQVDDQARQEGWGEYGYFVLDEPGGHMTILSRELMKVIKSVNPAIRTGSTYAEADILGPWLNIYMCEMMRPSRQRDPNLGKAVRAAGCQWWSYRNNLQDSQVPAYVRFAAGWQAFKTGLDGVTVWIYQESYGNPFNHLDARSHDWGVAYPGSEGPLSTIQYEAMREGIDDLRYMQTLRRLIAEHQQSSDPKAALAREANAWLESVLDSVDVLLTARDFSYPGEPVSAKAAAAWPPEKFEQVRQQAADFILRLQR